MITVIHKRQSDKNTDTIKFIPIHRPNHLGNPFYLSDIHNDQLRDECCEKYEKWLIEKIKTNPFIKAEYENIKSLHHSGYDVRLVCFCSPKRCHGDSIKKLIEGDLSLC